MEVGMFMDARPLHPVDKKPAPAGRGRWRSGPVEEAEAVAPEPRRSRWMGRGGWTRAQQPEQVDVASSRCGYRSGRASSCACR